MLHDSERPFRLLLGEVALHPRAIDGGLRLAPRSRCGVNARLGLRSGSRIEKRWRKRHEPREHLLLFDCVTGFEVESGQVPRDGGGNEIAVFDASSTVFIDRDHQRTPSDFGYFDFDGVRNPGHDEEADNGQPRENKQGSSNPFLQTRRLIHAPSLLTLISSPGQLRWR